MVEKRESGLYGVKVDGKDYEFEKWGAEEALDVLLDISKVIGKPLGSAMGAIIDEKGKPNLDKEFDPQIIALVFEALTDRLDKGVVMRLIKKLTSDRVFCDGAKINFSEHYKDQLGHMFMVAQAALEVQYGNFFGALSGVVGKFRRQAPITNQTAPI